MLPWQSLALGGGSVEQAKEGGEIRNRFWQERVGPGLESLTGEVAATADIAWGFGIRQI